MDNRNIDIGMTGEEIAANFLEKQGCVILERNYRAQHGEIDIIARTDKHLIFVEVKTRTSSEFGTPAEKVDRKKRNFLIRTAELYLYEHPTELYMRFDVAEVMLTSNKRYGTIRFIEDAFIKM